MAKVFRVRPHDEGGPVIVRTPWVGEGAMDVPNPAQDYAEDHPLVEAYPWLFRETTTEDVPEPEGTETTTSRKRTTTRRKAAE
jgi:hypothetical protein